MGAFSREKGARVERQLRDVLRKAGYEADRVVLSGAAFNTRTIASGAAALKGDVVAQKDNRKWIFEVKARREAFKRLYDLLTRYGEQFLYSPELGEVGMSYDLEAVLKPEKTFNMMVVPMAHLTKALVARIYRLRNLLNGAQVLALKDNNKPFIYVRFYASAKTLPST